MAEVSPEPVLWDRRSTVTPANREAGATCSSWGVQTSFLCHNWDLKKVIRFKTSRVTSVHHGGREDQLALVVWMANSSPTFKVVIVHAEVRLHRETGNTFTGLEAHFIWFYESSQPLSALCPLFFPSVTPTLLTLPLCAPLSSLMPPLCFLLSLKELKSAAWMAFSVQVQPPCQR